jgi:hypothetical protein
MDGNPERNNPGRVFGVYGGNGPALDGHDAMLPGVGELWTESQIALAMVTSFMRSKRYGFTCDDQAKSESMCLRNTVAIRRSEQQDLAMTQRRSRIRFCAVKCSNGHA